ncbi:hypothetical protein EDD96_2382 [Streptomyces sp. Ag109_G2-6]|uniref:hypothetical protein n=1 Tax=Streptomyces sp. Ag109_G2-6 TaxID=2485154 RepID=UPI000F4F4E9E|nr:hypothetical protein [Streptomyces sp. Ag109_G2-6]RPF45817.1 hypothetical protein EDD96_2382 [Streptomyces sp. Ag109_G2-6]
MISEPEIEGEWSSQQPEHSAADGAAAAAGPDRALRAAHWRWALGGALVACAVFAGGLVVQERYGESGPPIRYRHSEQLCAETPLKAVGAVLGGLGGGVPKHGETPALDWSSCFADGSKEGQPFMSNAQLMVELHKKTDPGPEFGVVPELALYAMPLATEQVSGLGERAFFSGAAQSPRLQVLDGGTVVTLTVAWWTRGAADAGDKVDEDAVKAAMVEDVRALLARLRQ